jgi:FkbM family methyltransferase
MFQRKISVTFIALVSLVCFLQFQMLYPSYHRLRQDSTHQQPKPYARTQAFVSDSQWVQYTLNFQARDPKHQSWCLKVLNDANSNSNVGSQFGQDLFITRNVFASHVLHGNPGFYIDSGANDAIYLSNTFFLDVCMGWKGLCVEPNPRYHASILEQRSCTLVAECISGTKGLRFFDMSAGETGGIAETGTSVMCSPLQDMLEEHAFNVSHVDFWSLDIEGHEMSVLQSIPWNTVSFGAILIEDFWISNRVLDNYMTQKGYVKAAQLAIDSVWLPLTSGVMGIGANLVFSPSLKDYWESNMLFRNRVRASLATDL